MATSVQSGPFETTQQATVPVRQRWAQNVRRARSSERFDDRMNRIESIRNQIAAGTYDTPERLELALDRMVRAVFPVR